MAFSSTCLRAAGTLADVSYLQQLGLGLQNPTYKGVGVPDRLRLSAIYWKSTPAVMEICSASRAGSGDDSPSKHQLDRRVRDQKAERTTLTSYLTLAATQYSVPTIRQKFAVPAGSGFVS